MGRFSNYCNNRFRGAFKHAVNKSIKEYQQNKQYNEENSLNSTQETIKPPGKGWYIFTGIIILLGGNWFLFFGGQNKSVFEDGFLIVLYAILTGIVDVLLIFFGTLLMFANMSSKKIVWVTANVIAIILTLGFLLLIIYTYLPKCYLCNKLLSDEYVTCINYKVCESCVFELK